MPHIMVPCDNARMSPPTQPQSESLPTARPGPASAVWRKFLPWSFAWLMVAIVGAVVFARSELASLREAFEVDARIMHRLLSQRASQQDAVLATLALLQAQSRDEDSERRLSSVYPQMIAIDKRTPDAAWPDAAAASALQSAEKASRIAARPATAAAEFTDGRFWLVLASRPNSYALRIDMRAMVPWSEWPCENQGRDSSVRVVLEHAGQVWVLQPGKQADTGWQFTFRKHLASESQSFDVLATRSVAWSELPWVKMLFWVLSSALLAVALANLVHQRRERERAQEWLRLGKVSRLNTLGELAAGMAHELNQPLTAVLANTQAAARLLKESPPDTDTARHAMQRASEQARRASDVLTRLRRTVERPDLLAGRVAVNLNQAVRDTLYLLEPQCREHGVLTEVIATGSVDVLADPVALEQVIHNIATNALQALEASPVRERRLSFAISQAAGHGELRITDNGPGIPAESLPHLFEPFFSTRSDGLGLGLSVCESLMNNMEGSVRAQNLSPQGAAFTLTLALAANAQGRAGEHPGTLPKSAL